MTDIIDRIRKHAPSEIDRVAIDIERRTALDNDKINQILTKVFVNIDRDHLSPELWYRWNDIKGRIQ